MHWYLLGAQRGKVVGFSWREWKLAANNRKLCHDHHAKFCYICRRLVEIPMENYGTQSDLSLEGLGWTKGVQKWYQSK